MGVLPNVNLAAPATNLFGSQSSSSSSSLIINPSWSSLNATPGQATTITAGDISIPVPAAPNGITPSVAIPGLPNGSTTALPTAIIRPNEVSNTNTTPTNTPAPPNPGQGSTSSADFSITNTTPAVKNATQVSPTNQSFNTQLAGAVQTNVLNDYYQPTYHFRLFVTGDAVATPTPSSNQITIAESGVTGYNIKEVEITTIPAPNPLHQQVTSVTMKIIDPVGVSFLDGLLGAAQQLNINNYTKSIYYLELKFLAYNTSGAFVNPCSTLKDGGKWTWSLNLNFIDTKINEGGGEFTLTFTIIESTTMAVGIDDAQKIPQQVMTVTGTTVREIYSDFVTKLNAAWIDHYSESGSQTLIKYEQIKTHPITVGPSTVIGKDPGDFKLGTTQPDLSSSRSWSFDSSGGNGKVTCHIPPGRTVNDFIMATLKNTEQGQLFFKDVPTTNKVDQTSTRTNDRGFRESTLFSIEPVIKYIDFEKKD